MLWFGRFEAKSWLRKKLVSSTPKTIIFIWSSGSQDAHSRLKLFRMWMSERLRVLLQLGSEFSSCYNPRAPSIRGTSHVWKSLWNVFQVFPFEQFRSINVYVYRRRVKQQVTKWWLIFCFLPRASGKCGLQINIISEALLHSYFVAKSMTSEDLLGGATRRIWAFPGCLTLVRAW